MAGTGLDTLFHYCLSSAHKPYEVGTIVAPILQKRRLRLSMRYINLVKVSQLEVAGQTLVSDHQAQGLWICTAFHTLFILPASAVSSFGMVSPVLSLAICFDANICCDRDYH